jgi:leucyl/phenylalanyl-tRNA--protein transferase
MVATVKTMPTKTNVPTSVRKGDANTPDTSFPTLDDGTSLLAMAVGVPRIRCLVPTLGGLLRCPCPVRRRRDVSRLSFFGCFAMAGAMTIDPVMLLRAYGIGVFPMSDDRDADEIYWVEPRHRAILPLEGFRLSHSLARTVRRERFRVTIDEDFQAVVGKCAESAPDRPSTWINRQIEAAYIDLHERGFAHSVECWDGDELVGGLYGVALGRAFFGESMFSRRTDASKVALAWLVARMKLAGFDLLDCQFMTDHLRSLGAVEIAQRDYLVLLGRAVEGAPFAAGRGGLVPGAGAAASGAGAPVSSSDTALEASPREDIAPEPVLSPSLTVSGPVSGQDIVQLLTHMS